MTEKKTNGKNDEKRLSGAALGLDLVAENKKIFVKKLYKKIKFMDKTLDDLQKRIKKEGSVIETQNGNGFTVLTENPAQKAYTGLIGKYNAAVKTLLDFIPSDAAADDELMSFIGRGL